MYNQILIDNPDAALAEISECFSWCGLMTAEWQEVLLDVTMLLLSFVDEAQRSTNVEVPESNISRQKWNRFAAE